MQKNHSTIDLRLKIINTILAAVGGVGVIASIWFGFAQLEQQSRAQTEAIRDQWRQTFYDQRMEIYQRATEGTGRIASLMRMNGPEQEIKRAIMEFRSLFWGPMAITEGADVENAMVYFNRGLTQNLPARDIEQLALYLAHVCRNEAYAYYNIRRSDEPASRYGANEEILEMMEKVLDRS
ncbi:MAG: hypothetical protein GF372_15095 [Candidatus Marinimicrobia bacterium]|nr:hypothetical protein [Candidatus Neomarinimicrobiota bacterium]